MKKLAQAREALAKLIKEQEDEEQTGIFDLETHRERWREINNKRSEVEKWSDYSEQLNVRYAITSAGMKQEEEDETRNHGRSAPRGWQLAHHRSGQTVVPVERKSLRVVQD
eukprot:SAG11_NODE_1002_length_6214_cov_2.976124_2_plen_111_part_00